MRSIVAYRSFHRHSVNYVIGIYHRTYEMQYEARHHRLIESVDERVLVRTDIGSECRGATPSSRRESEDASCIGFRLRGDVRKQAASGVLRDTCNIDDSKVLVL